MMKEIKLHLILTFSFLVLLACKQENTESSLSLEQDRLTQPTQSLKAVADPNRAAAAAAAAAAQAQAQAQVTAAANSGDSAALAAAQAELEAVKAAASAAATATTTTTATTDSSDDDDDDDDDDDGELSCDEDSDGDGAMDCTDEWPYNSNCHTDCDDASSSSSGPSDENDEEETETTWYMDADGDGYGDESDSITSESSVGSYTADNPNDCDDDDEDKYEKQTLTIDNIDYEFCKIESFQYGVEYQIQMDQDNNDEWQTTYVRSPTTGDHEGLRWDDSSKNSAIYWKFLDLSLDEEKTGNFVNGNSEKYAFYSTSKASYAHLGWGSLFIDFDGGDDQKEDYYKVYFELEDTSNDEIIGPADDDNYCETICSEPFKIYNNNIYNFKMCLGGETDGSSAIWYSDINYCREFRLVYIIEEVNGDSD